MIAESIDDALIRIQEYCAKNEVPYYNRRGIELPYSRAGTTGTAHYTNAVYTLTILNLGEVIDNDNS